MNIDQLLDVASYTGKLLIENGAEIYRAEETMARLCTSFSEAEGVQSFVTAAGIMLSITAAGETHTKVLRVRTRGVDLSCIGRINSLPREAAAQNYTIEKLALRLRGVENKQRYSFWMIIFFGALSAGGFVVFFSGNYLEAGCSFLIELLIKAVSALMEQHDLHSFFTDVITAASGALAALGAHALCPDMNVDILIVSSIMPLVPDLTITSAIRDMVSRDYLPGVTRATGAFLVAITITAGIGVVLSMSIELGGGT